MVLSSLTTSVLVKSGQVLSDLKDMNQIIYNYLYSRMSPG
jgi:hypothetical protein